MTLGVENLSEALGCERLEAAVVKREEVEEEEGRESEEREEERRREEEAQFTDSTAFLKGTQSLNPHNDYSQVSPEAEKLKTFWRADFCMQNFPDDKKVRKFKFCNKNSA